MTIIDYSALIREIEHTYLRNELTIEGRDLLSRVSTALRILLVERKPRASIDNSKRQANWKDIAAEFASERDALREEVYRMQEERDLAVERAEHLQQILNNRHCVYTKCSIGGKVYGKA